MGYLKTEGGEGDRGSPLNPSGSATDQLNRPIDDSPLWFSFVIAAPTKPAAEEFLDCFTATSYAYCLTLLWSLNGIDASLQALYIDQKPKVWQQLLKIVLLDCASLDTMYNVPDFLTSRSFINVKKWRFLDLQCISYSNQFKIVMPFSNLLHYALATCSEIEFKTSLFQRTALLFCDFLHRLKKCVQCYSGYNCILVSNVKEVNENAFLLLSSIS